MAPFLLLLQNYKMSEFPIYCLSTNSCGDTINIIFCAILQEQKNVHHLGIGKGNHDSAHCVSKSVCQQVSRCTL